MSIVGEAMGALGLLGKGWGWLRDRLDPARAQAKRLIFVFEAYGIARQQIPRLLPAEFKSPNAIFSSPDKLKDHLSPALLDWAAEHLAINRSWLDGVGVQPHLIEDHYKAPADYREWLAKRRELAPDVHRNFQVWKAHGQAIWPDGGGPLCLVYEETSEGLDASEFSRYWLLSDQWSLHHAPCIENMIAAVAVARSLGILVLGRDIHMNGLRELESGRALLPAVHERQRGRWHPEDLIEPIAGHDTEWRKALWKGAQAYLGQDEAAGPTAASRKASRT